MLIPKNQRVDAFPASSGNMYAATSSLTKSEAKTLSESDILAFKLLRITLLVIGSFKNPMPETHQIVSKFMNMFGIQDLKKLLLNTSPYYPISIENYRDNHGFR
uniref:Uncharacterized protein n=1 Tax=Romanomermis culicivorax TaxID=13658 RepID=A0A915JNK6_ROMCU